MLVIEEEDMKQGGRGWYNMLICMSLHIVLCMKASFQFLKQLSPKWNKILFVKLCLNSSC